MPTAQQQMEGRALRRRLCWLAYLTLAVQVLAALPAQAADPGAAASPWLTATNVQPEPPVAQSKNANRPSPRAPAARGETFARGADLGGDARRTRFIIDLSQPVPHQVFTLADPYRVIIDLPSVKFQLPQGLGASGQGLVKAFRYGLFAPGKSRIVIDTAGPVLIERAQIVDPRTGAPVRLLVDLTPTDRATFLARQRPVVQQARQPALNPPLRQDALACGRGADGRPARPVIVIDPGHGGVDNGAIGISHVVEKDIVLSVARRLRDALTATGRYQVLMTREEDVFVPLDDRVEFSQRTASCLFISIHADSAGIFTHRVRGATVYTLSETASDEEARQLADKENSSDLIAGLPLPRKSQDEVKSILTDLLQRENDVRTRFFIGDLTEGLRKTIALTPQPHREARFRVLQQVHAPAVLVELGFLTNRTDETLLKSADWQARAAGALAAAIDTYFSKSKQQARHPFYQAGR